MTILKNQDGNETLNLLRIVFGNYDNNLSVNKNYRIINEGDCKISVSKNKTRLWRVFDMIVRIQPPTSHAAR
jgi:hypothetical protein